LHQRLAAGGFSTEDALSSFLPLLRQVAGAHRAGLVAPLAGTSDLHVQGVQIWLEEACLKAPVLQAAKVRQLEKQAPRGVDVVSRRPRRSPTSRLPIGTPAAW
jgi:hypothetical protein